MSYQFKGLQFSLLIHAAIFALISGTDISESRLEPPLVIDFSIIEELKEEVAETPELLSPQTDEKKIENKPIEEIAAPPQTKVEPVQKKEKKLSVRREKSNKPKEETKKIIRAERKKSPPAKPVKEESPPVKSAREEVAKPVKEESPPVKSVREEVAKPVKEEVAAQVKEASPLPVNQANENVKGQNISSVENAAPSPPSDTENSPPARSLSENSAVASHGAGGSGKVFSSSESRGDAGAALAGHPKSGSGGTSGSSSDNLTFGSAGGPKYRHKEMPVYPNLARRLGKEGKVLLRLTIDENGSLLSVEVIEDPGYGFADAAVASVKKSTFVPPTWNGRPIRAKALLPVQFMLR